MICPDNIHYGNCLRQEIFEEILRGNKAWSSICRDKPLFPHIISSLISIRRIYLLNVNDRIISR